MNHTGIDKLFRCLRQSFVVLTETPIFAQPSKGAFHDPTGGQDNKATSCIGTFDNLYRNIQPLFTPLLKRVAIIRAVQYEALPAGKQGNTPQQVAQAFAVLPIRRMYQHAHEQAQRVYDDMALAPFDTLMPVIAPCAPFSVVLTDWLSATSVLGSAARPAVWRTWPRNASFNCCQMPCWLSNRKYEYTVCHAGKSCGNIRHEPPVRNTYHMPFNNSRSLCRRGRPVRALGNSGSRMAHSLSLKSLGYAFRWLILSVYQLPLSFKTLSNGIRLRKLLDIHKKPTRSCI